MYNFIEVINSCIESIIIVFYISFILEKKEKLGKWITALSCVFIALVLSLIALFFDYPAVQITATFVLMMLVSVLFYSGRLPKKLFISGIFIIIIFASESIFLCLLYILNMGDPADLLNDGLGRVIGMAGSKILYFWLTVYVCHFLKAKMNEISLKNWTAIILAPILSIVILNSIFISSNVNDRAMILYIISVLSILLFNFYIFNFFETYNSRLKIAIMEKVIEAEEQNYKLIENKYEEIRNLKHDIKNQISTAERLFCSDRNEALRHLNNLSEELSRADGVCHSKTAAVDAIVNMKMSEAEANGIKCTAKIVTEYPVSADTMLLCRILANALDNAIEGCERYDGVDKYIFFVLSQAENNLYIEVSNSSCDVDVSDIRTEKSNKLLHGIGLKSIGSAVKDLGGIVSIDCKNNVFIIKILI